MVIERILSTSNHEFANFTMVIGSSSKGAVNISVDIFQDLLQVPIYVTFSIPADKNDENYSKIILKATINICRVIEGVAGDFMSRMLSKEMRRISDFPLKCPFPKGSYKFTNFIMRDKFLPSYLFVEDIKYLVNAKVMGKIQNHKNLVLLFNARSYGVISNS